MPDRGLDSRGIIIIIRCHEADVLALRQRNSVVQRPRKASILSGDERKFVFICQAGDDLYRQVFRPIIDRDYFDVPVRLRHDALNGPRHILLMVV